MRRNRITPGSNPTGGSFEPNSFLCGGAEAAQETDRVGTPTYLTRGFGGSTVNRRIGATGSPSYYHDANGSVVGLSNASGAKTDTYSYDAFVLNGVVHDWRVLAWEESLA